MEGDVGATEVCAGVTGSAAAADDAQACALATAAAAATLELPSVDAAEA
jgi:hypothetical protein